MTTFDEATISRAILDTYHQELTNRLVGDVLIAGAGPSGLMAACHLARQGLKVAVLEKRLAPGGGIWGGGIGMSQIVVPDEALPLLDEMGIQHVAYRDGLHTANAIELAAGLCVRAIEAGAAVLNLLTVEDLCVHDGRVVGLVVNRSLVGDSLPVDPITFSAKAVLDATGHEAVVAAALQRRGLLASDGPEGKRGEGPMNATEGEAFVVDNVSEVYPGLWVAGMSVCAVLGGPRMGPIFGGMLLSGRHAAQRIAAALTNASATGGARA
jgi:thiamine thiazole synthase